MRFIFVFICSFFSISSHAESLLEIYRQSVEHNYKIKSDEYTSLAKKELENIALSGLLPQVSFEASMGYAETELETNSSNPFAIDNEVSAETDIQKYSLTLTQPLFDFSAYYNYEKSQLSSQIAVLEYEQKKQNLMLKVVGSYLNILNASAKYNALLETELAFKQQLDTLMLKVEYGTARVRELNDAQSSLDLATAEKIIALHDLNALFDSLQSLTGKKYSMVDESLPDNLMVNPPEYFNYSAWEQASLSNSLSINISMLQEKEAHKNLQVQKSKHAPTVYGKIGYNIENSEDRIYSLSAPQQINYDGWHASISLTVPIYSGGRTSGLSQRARYLHLAQKNNHNQVKRDVIKDLQLNVMEIKSGASLLNARKTARESSINSVHTAKKAYNQGSGTLNELLDAQKLLNYANQTYSEAVYHYLFATFKLKSITGLLTINDIKAVSLQLNNNKPIANPELLFKDLL